MHGREAGLGQKNPVVEGEQVWGTFSTFQRLQTSVQSLATHNGILELCEMEQRGDHASL